MNIEPVSLNGVNTYPFSTPEQLIEYVNEKNGILIAVNAEKILHANEETRNIINKNIGYPDGIGAVWALRKKGIKSVRIPGVELWLKIVETHYKSKKFYLVGGKKEIIEKTVKKLREEFQGIDIINFRDGYIKTSEEERALIEDIKQTKPEIVFVAMGSPRQEILMSKMQKAHPAIYQGLGGSFDVFTGHVKRAPKFWRNIGFEWFYRWINDPLNRTKRNLNLFRFYWKLKTNQL